MALSTGRRAAARAVEISFAAGDEERRRRCEAIQPLEIEVAAIHHIERPRLDRQLVEDVHIVHFPVGNVDKAGDVAPQVEQRMQLEGTLAATKLGPRKQAQTQVDGRGVERVDRLCQIDGQRFPSVQPPPDGSRFGRSRRRFASRAPRWRRPTCFETPTAKPEMIELRPQCMQTDFNVSKTFPKRQLSECQRQELIETREGLHFERAPIAGDATAEGGQRKMLHQLREHQLASVHRCPPRSYASQGGRIGIRRSNRDQENLPVMLFSSIIYGNREPRRWDTTEFLSIFIAALFGKPCTTSCLIPPRSFLSVVTEQDFGLAIQLDWLLWLVCFLWVL